MCSDLAVPYGCARYTISHIPKTGPALTCRGLLLYIGEMSDRKALAREIAARTTPLFIEIKKVKWDEMLNVEKVRKRLARLLEK